jgi:hypothetical protein
MTFFSLYFMDSGLILGKTIENGDYSKLENQDQDIKIDERWYYVIIQNPNTSSEQYVGFTDEKINEKFIPAFKTKENAQRCFALMPKDIFNATYGIQAVIEEDLFGAAMENGHKIYLLDEKGTILDYLN